MINNLKARGAVAFVMLFILIAPHVAYTQDSVCEAVVQTALNSTREICDATGRNQACYGNFTLEAAAQPNVPAFDFDEPGDLVDLVGLQSLRLSSMNEVTDEWGVALMRLQANIPDTLPGQNVTFVLFGDTEITSAVPPEDVVTESEPLRPMQAFYLNTGLGGATCTEAPESGLLVQTPEGVGEISLQVNEVNIMLGSTAFFQVLEEEDTLDMRVSALEGAAFVEVDGGLQVAVAGTWLRVPIERDGERLRAIAPPEPPLAYQEDVTGRLPVQLLERRIDIATPLTEEQVEVVRQRITSGQPLCDTAFFPACDTIPPAFREGIDCLPSDDVAAATDRPCRIARGDDDRRRPIRSEPDGVTDVNPPPTASGSATSGGAASGDCSISGDTPTTVTFINESNFEIMIYWVSYDCEEVLYNTLAPGQSYIQDTFLTHAWIVRDTRSGITLSSFTTRGATTIRVSEN